MERRCPLAVGRADNAKLHHVLEFGLSDPPFRLIKPTIPLKGCWISRADVMDNIVWWRITGAGEVRKIGILPYQRSVRARGWGGEMGETLKRAGDGVTGH